MFKLNLERSPGRRSDKPVAQPSVSASELHLNQRTVTHFRNRLLYILNRGECFEGM